MRRLTISKLYIALTCLGAVATLGCSGAVAVKPPVASRGDFDKPVPASEPRDAVDLRVDLKASSDCEERFDLALYENRGVELVAWDDKTGQCAGRDVNVRYLTAKLNREAVLALAREHAKKAEPATGTAESTQGDKSAPATTGPTP